MNSQFRNYFASIFGLVLAVLLLIGCEVKNHEFIGLNVPTDDIAQATAAHHTGFSAYLTESGNFVLVTPAGRRWMQTGLPAGINDIAVARDIPNSLTFYVIEGGVTANAPGQVWWIQAGSSGFSGGELFVTENAELESDPATTLAMEYDFVFATYVTSTEQAIYVLTTAMTGYPPDPVHHFIVRYDVATEEKVAIESPFPTDTSAHDFTEYKQDPIKNKIGLATSSYHEDDVIWLFRTGRCDECCGQTDDNDPPTDFAFAQRVDGGYTDATSPTVFPFQGGQAVRPDVEHGGDLFDEWIFAFRGSPCDSSEDELQLIGEDSEDIYVSKSSLGSITSPGGSLSLSYLWYPWKTSDPDYDGEKAVHLTHPGVSPTWTGRVFGDREDSYALGRITVRVATSEF